MFKARGGKAKANALSPVLLPPPPPSAGGLGPFCGRLPRGTGRAGQRRSVGTGGLPPGQIPGELEGFMAPKYITFSPALFPEGSFTSLRSDGQGPASTGPPPVPAVGKRLRASVSPSCRRRPILLAYFPKHLQTYALCWLC